MNKVELVNRSIIEHQVLVELSDKSKVAILATKDDLETLIAALDVGEGVSADWAELRDGLKQLKREAFPE